MKVKELREKLESLPDDYNVEVAGICYPEEDSIHYWPEYCKYRVEIGDTGHSDEVFRLNINLDNPL